MQFVLHNQPDCALMQACTWRISHVPCAGLLEKRPTLTWHTASSRCSSLDSPEAEAIAERYAMPLGQQMLEPPAPRNGKVSRRSNATVIYAKELRRALATS